MVQAHWNSAITKMARLYRDRKCDGIPRFALSNVHPLGQDSNRDAGCSKKLFDA